MRRISQFCSAERGWRELHFGTNILIRSEIRRLMVQASGVKNQAKFCTFRLPVKLGDGPAKILIEFSLWGAIHLIGCG